MSRNAMDKSIAEVEEREDQMRIHRQEYLESIAPQMTARRVVTLQEECDRLREALQEVCRVFESNPASICDTVWVTGNSPETLYDRCRAALGVEE
jgi:hypothetical protein